MTRLERRAKSWSRGSWSPKAFVLINSHWTELARQPLVRFSDRGRTSTPLHKMTAWCRGYLEAAVDHMILWADYAVPLKFHPETIVTHSLRPALTLARAAMESASQTIWILGSDDKVQCAQRYVQLAVADLIEHVKAAETFEKRSPLQRRSDELFAALGVTHRTFVAPTSLEMVRFAAEYLQSDLASDADVTLSLGPDRVERLWRSAAGAAHGKRWPEWEFQSVVTEPYGE